MSFEWNHSSDNDDEDDNKKKNNEEDEDSNDSIASSNHYGFTTTTTHNDDADGNYDEKDVNFKTNYFDPYDTDDDMDDENENNSNNNYYNHHHHESSAIEWDTTNMDDDDFGFDNNVYNNNSKDKKVEDNNYDDDNDDDPSVNWEDADHNDHHHDENENVVGRKKGNDEGGNNNKNNIDENILLKQLQLRPVTIDMNTTTTTIQQQHVDDKNKNHITTETKKKKLIQKTKRKFRVSTLPCSITRTLVHLLHESHVLTLTSHAVFLSSIAAVRCTSSTRSTSTSNNNLTTTPPTTTTTGLCTAEVDEFENNNQRQLLFALAHSLLPRSFILASSSTTTSTSSSSSFSEQQYQYQYQYHPTLSILQSFTEWYFDFIHETNTRRQRQTSYIRARGGGGGGGGGTTGGRRRQQQQQQTQNHRRTRSRGSRNLNTTTNQIIITTRTTERNNSCSRQTQQQQQQLFEEEKEQVTNSRKRPRKKNDDVSTNFETTTTTTTTTTTEKNESQNIHDNNHNSDNSDGDDGDNNENENLLLLVHHEKNENDPGSSSCSSSSSGKTTTTTTMKNVIIKQLYRYIEFLSDSISDEPQLLFNTNIQKEFNILFLQQNQQQQEQEHSNYNNNNCIVLLFMIMIRSMGWRCRYVQGMNPLSCIHLDVHHPLFFPTVTGTTSSTETKKKKNRNHSTNQNLKETSSCSAVGWVEVLCSCCQDEDPKNLQKVRSSPTTPSSSKQQQQHRWVHVDPIHQILDQPDFVERMFAMMMMDNDNNDNDDHVGNKQTKTRRKKQQNGTLSRTRRMNIVYAVGVEHYEIPQPQQHHVVQPPPLPVDTIPHLNQNNNNNNNIPSIQMIRFTDVTPRYSSSWSTTLKLRGLLEQQNKKCISKEMIQNSWWNQSIKKMNEYFSYHPPIVLPLIKKKQQKSGTSKEDAVNIFDSDDDDHDTHKNSRKHAPVVTIQQQSILSKSMDFDEIEKDENEELHKTSSMNEAIPTSKVAFQSHPIYVIPSILNQNEVLAPDCNKRIKGVFKGEIVYLRSDVSIAYPAKKWYYKNRQVRTKEMKNPVKRIKARKKPTTTSSSSSSPTKKFQSLRTYGVGKENDGSMEQIQRVIQESDEYQSLYNNENENGEVLMQNLYAIWQTDDWEPMYVGPDDMIPVNEHKNIELELLNPGLVHIDIPGLATVAKKLGIPYAPCLVGFEGHHGNRTPTIRGIIVHEHNEPLIREAGIEVTNYNIVTEYENQKQLLLYRWKKLMVGLLTKERIEREYGDHDTDEVDETSRIKN